MEVVWINPHSIAVKIKRCDGQEAIDIAKRAFAGIGIHPKRLNVHTYMTGELVLLFAEETDATLKS